MSWWSDNITDPVSDAYDNVEDSVSDEWDRVEDSVSDELDRWGEDIEDFGKRTIETLAENPVVSNVVGTLGDFVVPGLGTAVRIGTGAGKARKAMKKKERKEKKIAQIKDMKKRMKAKAKKAIREKKNKLVRTVQRKLDLGDTFSIPEDHPGSSPTPQNDQNNSNQGSRYLVASSTQFQNYFDWVLIANAYS